MNEAIQFMHKYCEFSDPNCVWVMKGISRNKDNPGNPNMHKFLRRMILTKPEDIETCYEDIHLMAKDAETIYRIYISLNSRDVIDAAFQFQKKLVDITQGLAKGREDALVLSKKIGSIWKTELEQKHARGTKRFLLDIDENNEMIVWNLRQHIEVHMDTTISAFRKTPNGYAIVFDACDTRMLTKLIGKDGINADLQRDSMLFVEQF